MPGDGAPIVVSAANVVVDRVTVTREGNAAATWNSGLNDQGIRVEATNVTITNSRFEGNRSAVDLRSSNNSVVHNNVITNNRTGVIVWGDATGLTFTGNEVSNNWTMGVLFQDDPVGSMAGRCSAPTASSVTGTQVSSTRTVDEPGVTSAATGGAPLRLRRASLTALNRLCGARPSGVRCVGGAAGWPA